MPTAWIYSSTLLQFAVAAGYWVWLVPEEVYYGIPLLNFVGWLVLMVLAPLAWIGIARRTAWGEGRKLLMALIALLPLCLAAIVLSLVLNESIEVVGLR